MVWGRRYGYGYGYGQPGKKATAASLSTATLQKIISQQKAEEEATARFYAAQRERQREAELKAAEERRLEELHGGREGLAKWREENRERLEAERIAKMEAARKAAGEQAVVTEMAQLRAELAALPRTGAATGPSHFQLNKAQIKQHFHLTDREMEALPKTVIQKEGAKKPSKILWESPDIFKAVARKEGNKKLRAYQAAYNPLLARRFVEDELDILNGKHPSLQERGRAEAVSLVRAADDAAVAAASKAKEAVEAAITALDKARDRQYDARAALREVATAEELETMNLVALPDEEPGDEAEDEPPEAADDGCRSTHPISKRALAKTPITAAAGGAASSSSGRPKKKARIADAAGPSSSGGAALAVD